MICVTYDNAPLNWLNLSINLVDETKLLCFIIHTVTFITNPFFVFKLPGSLLVEFQEFLKIFYM